MKRLIGILVPVLILGSLIVWRFKEQNAQKAAMQAQRTARTTEAPRVSTVVAARRDIEKTYQGTGSLESPISVNIAPKVTGQIVFLQVQEGDAVRKGQVLVRLDTSDVEAQVRQAQAAVAEAKYRLAQAQITEAPTNVNVATQIRQAQANVASAKADLNQAQQTYQSQVAAAEATVTDDQAKVDAATAAIGNAQAGIKSAKANLADAQTKYNRYYSLYKQGYIAAQDVDDVKAALEVQQAAVEAAEQQLKSAQASRDSAVAQKQAAQHQAAVVKTTAQTTIDTAKQKVAQAQASYEYAKSNTAQTPAYKQSLAALESAVKAAEGGLESARAQLSYTTLTSPADGYVTSRMMDPGAMATVGQPILTVQDFSKVWVSVSVPDVVAARMHLGQPVTFTFDALPGKVFAAKVVQINQAADAQARQFSVRAELSNPDGVLKPGMFAHVTIVTEKVSNVVSVPREAIQEDTRGYHVVVVGPDDVAHYQAVTTGLADANFTAIKTGLQAGERVVVLSAEPVKDGQKVELGTLASPKQIAVPAGASSSSGQ